MNARFSGPQALNVIARPEGPGCGITKIFQGLKGRPNVCANPVPPLHGGTNLLRHFPSPQAITWRAFGPPIGCTSLAFDPVIVRPSPVFDA